MLDAEALVKILSQKGLEHDPRCDHLLNQADDAGLIDYPTLLAAVSEVPTEHGKISFVTLVHPLVSSGVES